jgi:polyisoprenoid-binding protein YceI
MFVRRCTAIVLAALLGAAGAQAQVATFASLTGTTGLRVQRFDIDKAHSAVEFSVRFMGLSRVQGAFSEFGGTLMYDPSEVARSTISIVIGTASINTNVAARDRDLQSANFFDAEKFPRITFRSSTVEQRPDGFAVRGPLSMHGVTREVTIPFKLLHPLSTDAWGNQRIGFVGGLSLNRRDYGILGTAFWNSEFDPGRMSISNEVEIELTLSAEVSNVDLFTTPKGDSVLAAVERQGLQPTLQQFRAAAADTSKDAGRFTEPILSAVVLKLMHRKRFADAVAAYRLATELKPDRAALHAGLGEAYLMTGKRQEAIASFRRAIELDTVNTVAGEYLRHLVPAP